MIENGLLAVLEVLKTLENKSRSVILERLIIFYLETQKGQSDEKAWQRSKRAYKRALTNKIEKNKLKRKQFKRVREAKKKKELQASANRSFSYFERS